MPTARNTRKKTLFFAILILILLLLSGAALLRAQVVSPAPFSTTATATVAPDPTRTFITVDADNCFADTQTSNGEMVVICRQDNEGWHLNEGEQITVKFKLDLTKVKGADRELGEVMELGYFLNGEQHKISANKIKACDITISATSTGEFLPYFVNLCAGYIVTTDGKVDEPQAR